MYARSVSRHSSALDSVTCDGCCLLSSASPVASLRLSPSVSTSPAACWPAHSSSSWLQLQSGHQRPWQRTDWTHQMSRPAVDQSGQQASHSCRLQSPPPPPLAPPSRNSLDDNSLQSFLLCPVWDECDGLRGGRDGWPLTLMCCDWMLICVTHPVTPLLIGGGTQAAWSKYMHAYSWSVHLLLVLITGVYSHCISLISIGTEQIPCL